MNERDWLLIERVILDWSDTEPGIEAVNKFPEIRDEVERALAAHIANLAAAIEARADELAGNGPALGHPVLVERDGYVSGLRAAAEIVRAQINP